MRLSLSHEYLRRMLATPSRWFHSPFGRSKWTIQLTLVVAAVGAGIGWLAASSSFSPTAAVADAHTKPRPVVYFSYVDDASDERGFRDFQRLAHELAAADPKRNTPVSLEFVRVVVGKGPTIEESLRAIVAANPAAIVATSHDVLEAAKLATQHIPLLFVSHADPVEAGHVRSIATPGVQRTGFTFHAPTLAKAVELLVDGFPASCKIGVVLDELAARQLSTSRALHDARTALPVQIELFVAQNSRDLSKVLARGAAQSVDAWYVPAGAALWNDEKAVIALMADTRKPVLYDRAALVQEGGLMAYEPRIVSPFRIWAHQLLLILQGVDAATIPIERPSHFELALNLDEAGKDRRLRPSTAFLERVDVFVSRGAHR